MLPISPANEVKGKMRFLVPDATATINQGAGMLSVRQHDHHEFISRFYVGVGSRTFT